MKIFIVHASAGAGHKGAAEAIKDAFDRADSGHYVRVIDSLDYTNRFFKKAYPRGYNFLVSRAPFLWGWFFYLTDFRLFHPFVRAGRLIGNFINGFDFYQLIIKEKPDCIISTHFLPTEIISNLKALKIYNGKHITCITDYGIHSFWVSKNVDNYAVASEYSKKELIKKGVNAERIKIVGIPIHNKFTKNLSKNEAVKKLGLKKGLFNILITGGGLGVGPIAELVSVISKCNYPFQLIVVCGNNKRLVDEIKGLSVNSRVSMNVYGFVDNINEFMDASDIIISKPGGLTVSEALAKGLPILVPSYINGHEEKNLRFLEQNNLGIKARDVNEVLQKLQELYSLQDSHNAIKAEARQLGKPNAAQDIVLLALR